MRQVNVCVCVCRPLVHERDQYLAWSLKRSKAVRGARVVVGVMGAGHMRGVVHALQTDRGGDTLRFSGGWSHTHTYTRTHMSLAPPPVFALPALSKLTCRRGLREVTALCVCVCLCVRVRADLVGNLNKKSEKRRQMLQAAQRFAIETALFLAAYEAWVAYGPNLSLP